MTELLMRIRHFKIYYFGKIMIIDGNVSFLKLPMQHTTGCCAHYSNDKRAAKSFLVYENK